MRRAATGKGTMRSTMRAAGVVMLIGAMTVTATIAAAGEPGQAGMLSLRLGVGAREAAMGGAGVASTSGAAAAYWNPALATYEAQGTSLMLQHHRWFDLFDHNAAALTHRAGPGVIGVTFIGLYSDAIDRYGTEPVGVPQGSFEPYDVAFGASYSRQLTEQFAAGIQAKFLYEKIDVYSDWTAALDIFLAHRSEVVPGLIGGRERDQPRWPDDAQPGSRSTCPRCSPWALPTSRRAAPSATTWWWPPTWPCPTTATRRRTWAPR